MIYFSFFLWKFFFHYKHTYLHLHYTTTVPQGSITNTHIYICTIQPRYPREVLQTHIFTFALYNHGTPGKYYKHTYLHLHYTTTVPQGNITNTHIYICTIQPRYPRESITNTHIYICTIQPRYTREVLQTHMFTFALYNHGTPGKYYRHTYLHLHYTTTVPQGSITNTHIYICTIQPRYPREVLQTHIFTFALYNHGTPGKYYKHTYLHLHYTTTVPQGSITNTHIYICTIQPRYPREVLQTHIFTFALYNHGTPGKYYKHTYLHLHYTATVPQGSITNTHIYICTIQPRYPREVLQTHIFTFALYNHGTPGKYYKHTYLHLHYTTTVPQGSITNTHIYICTIQPRYPREVLQTHIFTFALYNHGTPGKYYKHTYLHLHYTTTVPQGSITNTHIYICTIQPRYPREVLQTHIFTFALYNHGTPGKYYKHTYLHLHYTTTVPQGSITNTHIYICTIQPRYPREVLQTHIFTFALYNHGTPGKYYKHTYLHLHYTTTVPQGSITNTHIYICTIQPRYPREVLQTHIFTFALYNHGTPGKYYKHTYLHLHYTTTVPKGSITNTHIYICTIQPRYPREVLQTHIFTFALYNHGTPGKYYKHTYLHLHYTTTVPQGSITNTHIYICTIQPRYPREVLQTHIFTFALYNHGTPGKYYKHTYLHLHYTTTVPQGSITNTHIYICTIQPRYPREVLQTHIFTFALYNLGTPGNYYKHTYLHLHYTTTVPQGSITNTHIYICTIQPRYPREVLQTHIFTFALYNHGTPGKYYKHTYLHLHYTTTVPKGSITNTHIYICTIQPRYPREVLQTHIFTFALYNHGTPGKYYKHTYLHLHYTTTVPQGSIRNTHIYICTIQPRYPRELLQTHIFTFALYNHGTPGNYYKHTYLHLHYTTTVPQGSITNTHIYICTIQPRYPREVLQTHIFTFALYNHGTPGKYYKHTYLHLHYITTVPQGSITNTHIYICTIQPRYPREVLQTHIFTFALYNHRTPGKYYKHTYLHLHYTNTVPQGSITNTHIYICTIQPRYPREVLQTHIFTFALYNHGTPGKYYKHTYLHLHYTTTVPQGSITILCLYPWDHLDNTTLNSHLGI